MHPPRHPRKVFPFCVVVSQLALFACQANDIQTKPTATLPPPSPIPPSSTPVLGPLINGDFETGDLTGWLTQASGNGRWLVYHADSTPPNIPAPPQGGHAALTVMTSHGSHTLWQDVALDARYILRFILFYVKDEGSFNDRNQLRVELMDPDSPTTSKEPADVLATIYRTGQRDPLTLAPTSISFDLSSWKGRLVRIRFYEVDTLGPFRVGVDDVRLELLQP